MKEKKHLEILINFNFSKLHETYLHCVSKSEHIVHKITNYGIMGNFLAGAVGFEPTNVGSKSRCLTEMRMKNVGLLGFIFLEF